MMKSYNFLLIDDKTESVKGLEQFAAMRNINLFHFETHKGGMEELERSINDYDAVILDALGYNESKDESEEITGLHESLRRLSALSREKVIPHCIYSAYTDKDVFEAQKMALPPDIRIFKKTGADSAKEMLAYLTKEADNQILTQIKNDNSELFKVLKDYSKESTNTFLEIFKAIKTNSQNLNDSLYFTPLRTILEEMFRKANESGLLHDACVSKNGNQVNLTESSKFLSGLDCDILGIRCKQTHFPRIIAETVKNFLFITGSASHTAKVDATENIDVHHYRKLIKTPYLLYSLVYQLADVLIWFNNYSNEFNDVAKNKSNWTEISYLESTDHRGINFKEKWITGEVERIAANGWGTVKLDNELLLPISRISVYKDVVNTKYLQEGDKVQLVPELKNYQSKEIEKY